MFVRSLRLAFTLAVKLMLTLALHGVSSYKCTADINIEKQNDNFHEISQLSNLAAS